MKIIQTTPAQSEIIQTTPAQNIIMEMTIYTVEKNCYLHGLYFPARFLYALSSICLFLIPFFLSRACTFPHIESMQRTNSLWIKCGGLGPAAAGSHREYRNQRRCGA